MDTCYWDLPCSKILLRRNSKIRPTPSASRSTSHVQLPSQPRRSRRSVENQSQCATTGRVGVICIPLHPASNVQHYYHNRSYLQVVEDHYFASVVPSDGAFMHVGSGIGQRSRRKGKRLTISITRVSKHPTVQAATVVSWSPSPKGRPERCPLEK